MQTATSVLLSGLMHYNATNKNKIQIKEKQKHTNKNKRRIQIEQLQYCLVQNKTIKSTENTNQNNK